MNHPSTGLRNESPACLLTLRFRGNYPLEPKLFPGDAASTAVRLETDFDVGMPLRDDQRHALVQLVFAHALWRSVHRPLQLITIPSFLVQERGRFSRIKANLGQKSALLIGE